MREKIIEGYGYLLEVELIKEIVEVGVYKKIEKGETLINYNQQLKSMPLLLSGVIKIMRQDEEGDELALYFLEKGESCTMTMNCCMGRQKSEIRAVAETDVEIILVPITKMKEWISKYDSWMAFVFESYSTRFNEMLEAIDSLAFSNMYDRLAKYLRDQVIVKKNTTIDLSHQEIAYDLHSSRVVISRVLKSLEKENKIKLGRHKIEVLEF